MEAKIKNQNYNDQVKQEGKNKKKATKPHSKQEEYARKPTTFKNFLKRDKDKCLTWHKIKKKMMGGII